MIPRTYPSTDASNGQSQLIGYYLGSVVGLTRWVDYIPVRFNSYLNGPENTYDLNGYIPVSTISSVTGLTPFKDYVPLFIDNTSTDVWTSNVAGYIPIGLKKSIGASLELDFTKTTTLDSRITFTRASTATYFDSTGVLQTAAINAPRFDFDPASKEPKGLLIEEQRTNLLTYSEQFDNAAWTKTRSTISANATTSPDGTVDADKLVEDTLAGTHSVRNATLVTITSGTTLTVSIYAKAAEGAFVSVGIGDGGGVNISRATFNLSTLAITFPTTAPANVSAPIPLITPVGNGWFRCSVTATVSNVTTAQAWCFKASSAGGISYTGDGTSGIYIWGAQLEAGAFATSYIPTAASQATRSADFAVMTGTNFSSWYNATEGTLYSVASALDISTARIGIAITDGTTTNRMQTGHGTGVKGFVGASGAQMSQSISSVSFATNEISKVSLAYKLNDGNVAANNVLGVLDTVLNVPSVNQARLGGAADQASSTLNGHLRKVAYYPARLNDTELKAITA